MTKLEALQEMAAMLPNGCTVREGTAAGVVVFIGMGAQIRTANLRLVAGFLLGTMRELRDSGELSQVDFKRAEALAERFQ